MLAAIISLLQDEVQPQPPKPRRVDIELAGGGGGIDPRRYDIVDYLAVLSTFEEVSGEHVLVRAARRNEHLRDGLERRRVAREERDRDMAAALLLGAHLEHARAQDERTTHLATLDELEQANAEIQRLRSELAIAERPPQAEPRARRRGERGEGGGAGVAIALIAGLGAGILIARRAR